MTTVPGQPPATLADLMRTEGKAELVGGRIIHLPLFGYLPGIIAGNLLVALCDYEKQTNNGQAGGATLAYAVGKLPSGRESISPDVSYYRGPLPEDRMSYIIGPPTFAVEVGRGNDSTDRALTERAAKREDYYAAGTLVVWDVDPLAETVTCYRAADPAHPITWRRGDTAEAEPAVPGWRMTVAEIFA